MTTIRRREMLALLLAAGTGAGAAALYRATRDESVGTIGGALTSRPVGSPLSSTSTSAAMSGSSTAAPAAGSRARESRRIEVICRDAWQARPAGGGMEEHTVERLTLHHSARAIDAAADGPDQIRSHQRFHQTERGWPDIAYHFIIDPGGNIYEGRDPRYRADTATEYDPTGHLLVCIDGHFDQTDLNGEQLRAAEAILAWAANHYNVDPATLAGHRDYADTACPGDDLYARLSDGSLLDGVRAVLDDAVPDIVSICDDEGRRVVAAIESQV